MKTFRNVCAQGDVSFIRLDSKQAQALGITEVPENVEKVEKENGMTIVAHSETGHHHAFGPGFNVELFSVPDDPFTCFLRVGGQGAELEHHRSHDTHETIKFEPGDYLVRRQREYTPEGFRMVQD